MAENYPALWREVASDQRYNLFNFVLKNPTLGARLESLCVKLADRVLVVVEESRDRLLAMGVPEGKVAIVSNTPSVEQISKFAGGVEQVTDQWRDRRVLIYQGYVNRARGLQAIVRALPGLVGEYRDLLLVVVGTGNDIENLKCLARELSVEAHTSFMGWVDHNVIPAMVLSSTAGLIPHSDTEHKRTTVPNKLFDYMACAKPVIVSSVPPLKRIVEAERCGVVFQAGDEASFARAVRHLLDNAELARDMGRRGEEAVRARYNWQYDAQVLAEVVGTVVRG
jgi:glycosyltransferase involved in cell wall biosynthesis